MSLLYFSVVEVHVVLSLLQAAHTSPRYADRRGWTPLHDSIWNSQFNSKCPETVFTDLIRYLLSVYKEYPKGTSIVLSLILYHV